MFCFMQKKKKHDEKYNENDYTLSRFNVMKNNRASCTVSILPLEKVTTVDAMCPLFLFFFSTFTIDCSASVVVVINIYCTEMYGHL